MITRHASRPAGSEPLRTNPLDEIRAAEARAASLVLQAGQAAEEQIAAARREAARCLDDARAAGKQAGEARRAQQIQNGHTEADQLVEAAQQAAQQLLQQGQAHLDEAVAWALALVLGEVRPGPQHTPAQLGQESVAAQVTNPKAQVQDV